MSKFIATVNSAGFLPDEMEPAEFESASDAWSYLADERRSAEDNAWNENDQAGGMPYSEVVDKLDAYASSGFGEGTVCGGTPGYEGNHDLGKAYSVAEVREDSR